VNDAIQRVKVRDEVAVMLFGAEDKLGESLDGMRRVLGKPGSQS